MSYVHIHTVSVHFGDCDPAGIVFFPNFARWMDQSSLAFFRACGVPPWRELERSRGIVGTPLLETQTRFIQPATYGDVLEVHTRIAEWRHKVFVHEHRILRDGELLCEGREVRAFVVRLDEASGHRLKSIPVPADIRTLCDGPRAAEDAGRAGA
ncbi:acyl-CoA thioesterase [Ideonella livida]|uniref:Acyl-CoA thioesterase n=1 Tax=Ideonella livida TaxID=2707176 RepID=A0A7C9TIS1_9BURK|nr:acyl-CoA thioesterase [Ideonella livida]NDY90045.1 acyl-CoA thioesterase [Ideonella livida]